MMAEELLNDAFPDLNDLENKIGRKTPESLLICLRGAASGRSGVLDVEKHNSAFSDSLSDKLYKLRQEMRWLRSADVRILQQLLTVHEGIETMRWLMEDRATLTSRGSNSTASLSSLTEEEEEEEELSPSNCRERPGSFYPLYACETTSEEAADQKQQLSDCGGSRHFESGDARPPSPPRSKFEVSRSARGNPESPAVTLAESLVVADVSTSQKQWADQVRPRNRSGAETIRKALLRCNTRKLSMDSSFYTQLSGEKDSVDPSEKSYTAAKEESPANGEKIPLGYSTQWYLVEPKDDVTFL